MNIKWETPPDRQRGGTGKPEEVEVAEALREHPDEWVRLYDFRGEEQSKAGAIATLIRSGKRAAFRADRRLDGGEFEAVSRKDQQDKNVTAVYVRYATLNND